VGGHVAGDGGGNGIDQRGLSLSQGLLNGLAVLRGIAVKLAVYCCGRVPSMGLSVVLNRPSR